MQLLYFQSKLSDDKNIKPKTICIEKKNRTYSETLKEIHLAIKEDYGISYIGENEAKHLIVLIRYVAHSNIIDMIVVRGTREEINDLQRDEFISSSMLR